MVTRTFFTIISMCGNSRDKVTETRLMFDDILW